MCESASVNSETKSTTSTASSNNGSSSSSGYRSGPAKISYAEMAQKPNKNSNGNIFDPEEKDNSSENIHIEAKLTPTSCELVKSENKIINSTKSSRKIIQSGSPRTPRHRNNEDNRCSDQKSELKKDTKLTETHEKNIPVKETYASKFGKMPSLTKSHSAPPYRTNTSKNLTLSLARNTNSPSHSNSEKCSNSLSFPKPLMSHIIKPPENKLHKSTVQQQQKQKQKISSETTQKTEAESKSIENETKHTVKD